MDLRCGCQLGYDGAGTHSTCQAPASEALMDLKPFRDSWSEDDPHANFKAEVACYTAADPLPTLENLSKNTGIPVGSLVRYVLVKYAASGSEAVLAMDPIVFRQMRDLVHNAEEQGSDEARLKAYAALKDIVSWLNASPAA